MVSNTTKKTTRNPLLKMEIASVLDGMVDVVKLLQNVETPTKPSSTEMFSGGGLNSCDRSLLQLGPVERTSTLKGKTRNLIRWHKCSSGAYLFMHPRIYGLGSMKEQADSVARVLGVGRHTTKLWFSIGDKKLRLYIEKWVPFVR